MTTTGTLRFTYIDKLEVKSKMTWGNQLTTYWLPTKSL